MARVGRRDESSLSRVGRYGRLDLAFLYRDGRTILAEAYAEPPFRVGRWFAEGKGLHMIIASSAPGVFGHDRLQQSIRIGRGARVRLTSQSAMQVHPSPDCATAHLQSSYHVEDGAHLHCDWHPLIPFIESRSDQRVDVQIDGDGYLYWSDAWMSGRLARGERWKFASLAHEIAVSRNGSLEYLERYRIEPSEMSAARTWAAGDASYLGTTLITGRPIGPGLVERLHLELGSRSGLRAAADRLDDRALIVRFLSNSGPAFHQARRWIGNLSERDMWGRASSLGSSQAVRFAPDPEHRDSLHKSEQGEETNGQERRRDRGQPSNSILEPQDRGDADCACSGVAEARDRRDPGPSSV